MKDLQRYAFDVQGYLVVRGAISADTAAALRADLERGRHREVTLDDGSVRVADFLSGSEYARELLTHPAVRGVLDILLGANHRLDHCYGMRQPQGTGGLALHGGPTDGHASVFYDSGGGAPRSGLTVVSWALTDQPATSGGFVCVPGSHKAAVALPGMMDAHREGRLLDLGDHPSLLSGVDLVAGDALIFTEALCHGARAWRAAEPRWSLLFKYTPRSTSWAPYRAPDPALIRHLTSSQRRLFAPPSG